MYMYIHVATKWQLYITKTTLGMYYLDIYVHVQYNVHVVHVHVIHVVHVHVHTCKLQNGNCTLQKQHSECII